MPNYAVADVARAVSAVGGSGGAITEAEPARRWRMGTGRRRPGTAAARVSPRRVSPARRTDGSRIGRARVGVHPRRRGRRPPRSTARCWVGASFPLIPTVTTSTRWPMSVSSTRPPPSVSPSSRRPRCTSASKRCYRSLRQVETLGGHAGEHAQDMGPYFTAVCTDDQGTTFGVMSAVLELTRPDFSATALRPYRV